MKVQQQFQSGIFNAFGHFQRFFQSAVAFRGISVFRGGISEQTQTYPVESVVFEDFKNVFLFAIGREYRAPVFLLLYPRNVGSHNRSVKGYLPVYRGKGLRAGLRVRLGKVPVNTQDFCRGFSFGEKGPRRLPGHCSVAETSGDGAYDVVDAFDVLGVGPVFTDTKGLLIPCCQIVQIGLKVFVSTVPLFVIGKSYDVVSGIVLVHVVQELAAQGVLSSQCQVDHQAGPGQHFPDCLFSGFVKSHKGSPVAFFCVVINKSFRPYHAVIDLVAYLDDLRGRFCFFHGQKYIPGVAVERIFQFFTGKVLPGRRFVLLVRICPCVPVMKIQGKRHAGGFDAPGYGYGLFQSAKTFF